MALKTEQITLDGKQYEVREQNMRVLLPILKLDPEEVSHALIQASTFLDNQAVGDGVLDLGFGDYQELMRLVQKVHGTDAGRGKN